MKVFHPLEVLTEYIEATCGENAHPDGTRYRVAIGREIWGIENPLVIKIQLVDKDSGVLGRRSPSFPLNTDDFDRVYAAVGRIKIKAKAMGMKVGGVLIE